MSFFRRILPGLVLLLAAGPAAGDGVDRYELAPSVMRANGQQIYPAGVSDPSQVNPPGPALENAVPIPPARRPPRRRQPRRPPGQPAARRVPAIPVPGVADHDQQLGTSGQYMVPTGTWSPPPAVQTPVYPSTVADHGYMVSADAGPRTPACWYARAEYFHWNERGGGTDFVNEAGALYTLGYTRQFGIERVRGELFGGYVGYQGYDLFQAAPGSPFVSIPLSNNVEYLGLRGEYEFVLRRPRGKGGRPFWRGSVPASGSRLPDGTDAQGNLVPSIQETWWTFYPYLGLETHLHLNNELELYSESRVGVTVLTYQFSSTDTNPSWPQPGIMANVELGVRRPNMFAAVRAEVMSRAALRVGFRHERGGEWK